MIRYVTDQTTGRIRVAHDQEHILRKLAAKNGVAIGPIRTKTDLAKALLASIAPSPAKFIADALEIARKSARSKPK